MDRLTPEHRSWNMSRIRGSDTIPEKRVRSLLHRLGFRFSLKRVELPGKPDIVLPSRHALVFVHGCFWHQHQGCRNASMPSTRRSFWEAKLQSNVARDKVVTAQLKSLGWRVLTVWECELKREDLLKRRLLRQLGGTSGASRPG
jgi:DNA mismatch endonuclease (patch repair protein)